MSDPGWCTCRLALALLFTVLLRPASAAVLPADATHPSKVLLAQARARDRQPPVLTLTEPADGAFVITPTITVRGTVTDESPVTVRVEGHRVPITAGAFTTDVSLHRGENRLEVEAQDAAGNRTRLTRNVRFEDLRRIQSLVPPVLAAARLPDLGHLALAPDGALLVTAPQAGRIYRIPLDGTSPQMLYDQLRHPLGIAALEDGTLYVAEQGADRILRIAPDRSRTVVLDRVDDPRGLALGRPGELFITAKRWPRTGRDEDHDVHRGAVLRLDLATGAVRVVADGLIRPDGIVAAADGQEEVVWVATERQRGVGEARGEALFRITLSGAVTPFPGPRLWRPRGLARDALGNLWLTARRQLPTPGQHHDDDADDEDEDWARGTVFKVSPAGVWHRFATGLDEPAGLAFEADGDLLVVEADRGRIVRFRAPPAPQVAAPSPTNAATITLTGAGEPNALIVARAPTGLGTAPTGVEGRFQVSVPLRPDQPNPIDVFAVAETGAGLTSASTIVTAIQDGTPPTLAIEAPPPNALTNGSPIPVRGQVSDANGPIQVFVNEAPVSVSSTGSIATTIPLLEGPNEIRVRAVDVAGNASSDARTIILDTRPPAITLTAPAPGFLTNQLALTVTGTVSDASAIAEVTLNGQRASLSGNAFTSTMNLAEGPNTITVRATDAAGNSETASISGTLDIQPPALTLASAPLDPTNIRTLTLRVSATDNVTPSAQLQFAFGLDSEADYSAYGTAPSATFTVGSDGSHTLRAKARDQAGNESAPLAVTVRVDTVAPAITLSAPPPDLLTNQGQVTVRGAVTDGSGVATVTVNGAAVPLDAEGNFTTSLLLLEGTNEVRVQATDAAGNTTAETRTVVRDTVKPDIVITAPAENAIIPQATIRVTGTVTDLHLPAVVTVNGVEAPLTSEGQFSADIPFPITQTAITVVATDRAGNAASATRTVIRDVTPPVLSLVDASRDPTNSRTLSLTVTATDNVTPTADLQFAFSLDSETNYEPYGASPTGSFTVTQDGPHTLRAKARDQAGNESAPLAVTVRVDTVAPAITLTAPADKFLTKQSGVTVSGTASDISPITAVTVSVNGQVAEIAGPTFSQTLTLAEGTNTITVSAADAAGNIGTASVSGTLDTGPPIITFSAPAAEAVLKTSPLTVAGTVSEAVSTLTVNGVAASLSSGTFGVSTVLTRGRNTLTATATDLAGNVGTASRSFTFDDVAPVVRILTPAGGQVLSQTSLTVTGTVDDPTASVTVNGVSATIQGGLFTASGIGVNPGPVTLAAQAVDLAGNVGADQVAVTVDTTPPSITNLTAPTEVTAGTAVALSAEAGDNLGLTSLDLLVDGRLVASGTTSPVAVNFTIPPDRTVNDSLAVTARAVDVAGLTDTRLASMKVTAVAVGPGFLRGLVLDDAKGLPLAGATVTVQNEGATPVDPQVTGSDGVYAFTLDPGTALVRVSKDGATTVERKAPVRSDLLTAVPDARLTAGDITQNVLGPPGGIAANRDNTLRLTIAPGALTADTSISLTPVSGQGLIARLPLGWSPITAVDIAPASLTLSSPGTLSVRLPEELKAVLPAGTSVTFARYDPAQEAWVTLDPGTVTSDGLAIQAALATGGQVAFLLPDAAPQSPPAAVAGQPLTGVSAATVPDDATATGSVTPATIPPGEVTAKGQVTVTPTAPLPSGTLVQAVVSEKYSLFSGEEVTPPAFVQDLILYQSHEPSAMSRGNALGTTFAVTPSKKYTLKDLAIGTVHLAIQTPETGGQGTIIGPEGGTLTASDGTILTIPPGALSRETVVAVAPVNEGDLRVAIPAGFQVLKAVNIDLTRATLSLSAEIAFPLPAGVASDTQVLVARILEVDGILRLQAVGVGQVRGTLLNSRGTVPATEPAGKPGVSLPGITSGGTYVVLRASTPVGFVAGTITGDGGTTRAGVVVSSGTGLVDVSGSDGRYIVATAAGSATITATDRATGQGTTQVITVAAGGSASQPLQVQTIRPTVVSVNPATGATSVPVNTQVSVTFSQPIAKVSLTGSSHATGVVLSGPSGPVEATITLSPLGTEATLYPSKAFASQTTYSLVASQVIQDTHGVSLAAPFTSQFTTANAPPPPPPAGNLTVSFPDDQGNVTVTATQGTAAPDNLVVVLNVSSGTVASATVGANGAFTTSLFAMLGDELLVMIQDAAGNQTVVSPGPYRNADGQFVMTRSGGSLDTPEGINLTLAPSAVTQPVTLKVTPLTLDQVAAAVPPGLQFLGGLTLDTQGATFKTGAKVSIPIPSGVTLPTGAQPFLARLQTIGGVLTPVLVDTMRVVNGRLTTASPPFPGVLKEGDYVALLPTNPYPAVVTGTVVRDGTTPPQPIAGAILRVDGTEVVATTDDKGKYALELFPPDVTKPRTFNLIALDPASGAMRGATLTVPAWTVPGGGGSYTLDVALPSAGAGSDTVPPKIALTVDAPSLRGGRVALGDTVTVTVKVTDEIGVRTDTLALTKNGASVQLTLGGAGGSSMASFVTTTPWEVITLVATAQDTSGNVGQGEVTIQVSGSGGGGGGGGGEVPPTAPPGQPLKVLSAGTFPPKGATQMDTATSAMLLFNQPVANASTDLLFLRERDLDSGAEATVDAEVQPDPADPSVVTLKPKSRLRYRASYTIVAKAGLQGANGVPLGQDYESDFSTLDLTGPSVPIANGRDVVILDKYAIVLDRTEGLVTVDISDPTKPTILETTPVFTGPFAANQGFAFAPDFAYVDPGTGQPVYAPAIVAVGWISLPQGGVRGLLRVFDLTDPIHPRRIGSATIARCTTGVPTQVLVKDQYAVVASLLQGLVVVDLNAVIGGTLADIGREGLSAGGGTLNQGTTLPIAGPIGMSFQEDAANERCDPTQPKAVVGIWDAGGQLKSPVTLKPYGPNALVGDLHAGVYRVALDNLPSLDGSLVLVGRAFRLDVLPGVNLTDPTTGKQRQADLLAVTAQAGVHIADIGTGNVLSSAVIPRGAAFDVRANADGSLLTVGTSGSGLRFYDLHNPYDLRLLGATPADVATGGVLLASKDPIAITTGTSDGTSFTPTDQRTIKITLYDALDFGPRYVAPATLSFGQDWTSVPAGAVAMRGVQADGASLLVIRAELPPKSKATEVKFSLLSSESGTGLGSTAMAGGLFTKWPTAEEIRNGVGSLTVTAKIGMVEGKRVAAVIYRAPTEFAGRLDYHGRFRTVLVFAETKKPEEKPVDSSESILIRRSPLVLIHGYKSGPSTAWDALIRLRNRYRRFPSFDFNKEVSYEDINAEGIDRIYKSIPRVIEKLQDQARLGVAGTPIRIAATRFDVLAHSMGGLATWTYISDLDGQTIERPAPLESRPILRKSGTGEAADQYYFHRSSNYGAGTIKRIITIGTPYSGSPVADRALQILTKRQEDLSAAESLVKVELMSRAGGNGDRTAYVDFSAESRNRASSAIGLLKSRPQTQVPLHTLVGTAGYNPCAEWLVGPATLGQISPAPAPSDMIVPGDSQRGGLTPSQSSNEPGPTQDLPGLCHTQETSSPLLLEQLPKLLNHPEWTRWFYMPGLPAPRTGE